MVERGAKEGADSYLPSPIKLRRRHRRGRGRRRGSRDPNADAALARLGADILTQEDAVKNARTVAKTRNQDLAERQAAHGAAFHRQILLVALPWAAVAPRCKRDGADGEGAGRAGETAWEEIATRIGSRVRLFEKDIGVTRERASLVITKTGTGEAETAALTLRGIGGIGVEAGSPRCGRARIAERRSEVS